MKYKNVNKRFTQMIHYKLLKISFYETVILQLSVL
jgi:hypothetical protein